MCLDLRFIEESTRSIAKYYNAKKMNKNVIIVEKSTVPVSTSKFIIQILMENQI